MPKLYLMRHGDAEVARGKPDRERNLTPQGVSDVKRQSERFAEKASELGIIIHSPYIRATQTANLVNAHYNFKLRILDHLVPNGSVEAVVDHVQGLEKDTLLVCHLPIVAEIARAFTKHNLTFFQGTIVCIERADAFARNGEFAWIQHPHQLSF